MNFFFELNFLSILIFILFVCISFLEISRKDKVKKNLFYISLFFSTISCFTNFIYLTNFSFINNYNLSTALPYNPTAIPGPTNWISEIIILNDSITNEIQSHVKILH